MTAEQLQRIEAAALSWLNTPWCPNSAVKGERGGVSCHNLPHSILVEAGLLSPDIPRITGDPRGVTANNEMERILDSRPEFMRIERDQLQPGDLIGLFLPIDAVGRRIKERCVNHLGVVLGGGKFIHVLGHKRTTRDDYGVPPWKQRITGAWRLRSPNHP